MLIPRSKHRACTGLKKPGRHWLKNRRWYPGRRVGGPARPHHTAGASQLHRKPPLVFTLPEDVKQDRHGRKLKGCTRKKSIPEGRPGDQGLESRAHASFAGLLLSGALLLVVFFIGGRDHRIDRDIVTREARLPASLPEAILCILLAFSVTRIAGDLFIV